MGKNRGKKIEACGPEKWIRNKWKWTWEDRLGLETNNNDNNNISNSIYYDNNNIRDASQLVMITHINNNHNKNIDNNI